MIESRKKKRGGLPHHDNGEKYRHIFENAVLGLFTVDSRGRFMDVNPAFANMLGYDSPGDFLTGKIGESDFFADPGDAGTCNDLIDRYGYIKNFETQVRRKDNSRIWASISARSATDTDKRQRIRYGIIEDITQRRIAEEAVARKAFDLARCNSDLEQFTHIASHDLQEPLRMVSSFTELLARRYKGRLDSDADEFISIAVDGANRMKQHLNDLLAYSRLSARAQLREPVDFNEAFNSAIGNLAIMIREHGAVVEPEHLPVLMASREHVVQLFQHLLSNAIKFHGLAQPRIKISARHEDTCWVFSVWDNGIGIDPQNFERIFVVFQRVHGKRDYPGTGMGLTICKKIVELHGGRIWVESEPGKGSVFFFTIADNA
jgi:PAS domain S-box-containing protein